MDVHSPLAPSIHWVKVSRLSAKLAALLIAGILMTGCAGLDKAPEAPDATDPQSLWAAQKTLNSTIEQWHLKGKIGVRSGKKGGSATLKWQFAGEVQDIELYGPFGGGRVQIDAGPEGARLEDTKGRVITGDSAQEVLEIRLGWHVPFDELVYWSRGLPGEQATDITIDAQGRLKSFNQDIWQVEYTEYRETGAFVLPRKITITSLPGNLEIYDDDGNYIGDELSVKVILKKWLDFGSSG